MASQLEKEYEVLVRQWIMVDSTGTGLFDYFTDYTSFDNATIYDATPLNNYAGRSILLDWSESSLAYNAIKKNRLVSLKVKTKGTDSTKPDIFVTPLLSEFPLFAEQKKITFANQYEHAIATSVNGYAEVEFTNDLATIQDAMRYGVCISGDGRLSLRDTTVIAVYVSPYAIKTESRSPSNNSVGNINDKITFSWALETDKSQADNPKLENIVSTVSSYKLYWRDAASSSDGVLLYEGTDPSYTAPANTFDGHTKIQWRVIGTMSNNISINPYPYSGQDDQSDGWFNLNLADMDATSTSKIIGPDNVSINGSEPIVLQWQHIVSTGTAQTRADIQTGSTEELLSAFASVQGAANTYTVSANTFQAGDLYWRVRTYNADGVAGEWSETAHVIVIGASPAPLLTLERISPRPIIRWEAQGQIAYELEIVGVESDTQYGQINRYEAKSILSPGDYTVRVRVQNKYSLWSAWAEAALPVTNAPGAEITLTATPDSMGNVSLSWSVAGLFERYEVLRDGNVIARTATTSFTDRLAIGSVQYQVRGIVDEAGNYSLSNAVEQTVAVRYVQIAPVSGGEWLALPYATTDIREVSTNVSRAVTYQQYTGAKLPTATVSEALTVSHQIATAFPWSQKAAADRLEAMIGQLVCVKDPRGERFVGVLGSYSKTSSRFYVAYSLTITPVDWEEVAT